MTDFMITFGSNGNPPTKTKAGRKKRNRKDDRPWLLGTDDIPPPLDVPWQMWSQSSNPYEGGLIQFEFTREGIVVGWMGEEKALIAWHELTWMVGQQPRDLQDEAQRIKEQAEQEGYALGLARGANAWTEKAGMWPLSPETQALVTETVAAVKYFQDKDYTV